MSADFFMQSGVLVHVVAKEYKAFMVQAAAVGLLAEDCVADGSCGSCRMVACLQQSSFWRVTEWQLTFVGAINGLMQQLLDFGSLMNLVPATFW